MLQVFSPRQMQMITGLIYFQFQVEEKFIRKTFEVV